MTFAKDGKEVPMIRPALIATLVALPLVAGADERPNIEPGLWEYTNTTKTEGESSMPEQTDTREECVTEEDIEEGLDEGFHQVQEDDDCEVRDRSMSADEATYTLICKDAEGTAMEMEMNMEFMGDRMEGEMNGEYNTEMGNMKMTWEIVGERVGDC